MEQGAYVGVDVSKVRLDVAPRPSGELFSEANDERAISRLVKRLKPLSCSRVVVEATGGMRRCWWEPYTPPVCRWW